MSADIRRRAALQQAIDGKALDEIIRTARIITAKLESSGMRASQLRNVVDVASDTTSIEAIANFIRYQIGRSTAWRRNNFGEEVVAQIREGVVAKQARAVAEQVKTRLQEVDPEIDQSQLEDEARLELTRLFLGYINRAFHYSDASGEWNYVL